MREAFTPDFTPDDGAMQLGPHDPLLAAQLYAARRPAADPRLAMPAFARALGGEAAGAVDRPTPDPARRPAEVRPDPKRPEAPVQALEDTADALAHRLAAVRRAEVAAETPERAPAPGSFLDVRV